MKYIASCSFGKDSLAMILLLLELNYPLDYVVFYDTGMEFEAIYRNRDKLIPILQARGVQFVELTPASPFLYDMLERPVKGITNADHNGYGWCGGACRWGTTAKNKAIDKFLSSLEEDYIEYIGIAYDEQSRIKDKCYPLVDLKMTERDCLDYCREREWDWKEGKIDLYDILDRVSCWCCSNKNRKELYNIFLYLPQYWKRLKDLQSKIDRPMKQYKNKKYGEYGNLFDMEKVFLRERSEWLDKLLSA